MSDPVRLDPLLGEEPVVDQAVVSPHEPRSLAERLHDSDLSPDEGQHLRRLVAWWGLLADLSFADLLLFVPETDGTEGFRVVDHMRPTTSQTLYYTDIVGQSVADRERPLVARAYHQGRPVEGEITLPGTRRRARVLSVPVRCGGRVVAVLTREGRPDLSRRLGELEQIYLSVFDHFARMVEDGTFPFATDETDLEEAPRVGDGVLLLDEHARLRYGSPNALSTVHRMGVRGNVLGLRLAEMGVEQTVVWRAYTDRVPVNQEVERGDDTVVDVLAIPILGDDAVRGALVILRDVSELRRRDRLLLSKDAAIREIHHRVKNNLQTISSLLRLQARRITSDEAKQVIGESVRRIGSIAVVHETLAHEAGEDVPLVGVVRNLIRLVEDSATAPERPLRITVEGDPGIVPASVVTPVAVVLNELLQNVVDHAYTTGWPDDPEVVVRLAVAGADADEYLVVEVEDDGVGLPEGLSVETASGLGWSIVRALVGSDLGGEIALEDRSDGGGAVARLRVPLGAHRR